MRADPRAADLQHDLGVPVERDRSRITVPEVPVDVCRDRAAVLREPLRPERLTPDREQVAERVARAGNLDHAGRLTGHDRMLAGARLDVRHGADPWLPDAD